MNLSLSSKKSPSDASAEMLVLGIPAWYRITALAITGALVASALAVQTVGLGWAVVALAAFSASYDERWYFDRGAREVRSRIGLVFLPRGPRCSFDEIARISVNLFAKGRLDQTNLPQPDKMPRGSQARLLIELKDGQVMLVDSVNMPARERLLEDARRLADFIGVPFD